MSAATEACIRVRARVDGTVQGVGFRPHVFRLATELGLAGFVLNDSRGVLLEIEGDPGAVEAFVERLRAEAPPLARIEAVASDRIGVIGEQGFRILASDSAAGPDVPVSPDMATCADCLAELFDPTDRRHRYPFINCTNCGPRFTIVLGVPYDRPSTTMAGFEMCGRCRAEYEDPLDRRFHAQPNACPDCGPRARLVDAYGGERCPGARADRRRGGNVARGRDRLRQGPRRLPPGLPRRRRARRLDAALSQAPRPKAVRAAGRDARRRPPAGRAESRRGGAAVRRRAADRDRPTTAASRGRTGRRARLTRPRRDAALLPPPPPPRALSRRTAGDDLGQPLRRADRVRGRRRLPAPRRNRRRLPRPRPPDPHPHRRLGRPGA